MPQLLGDKVLPETVVSKRRTLREKVRDFREPVRQSREDYIPGPDVVGMTEDQISGLREKFVSRDGLIDRINDRRSDDSGSGDGGSGSSGDGSGSKAQTSQMT